MEVGGASLSDVRFLGITHMKRSFYLEILQAVGLTPEQSVYLEDYGHVQSVDQVLALELGLAAGKIQPGDLVVLAGAGTGYTWSAIALRWGMTFLINSAFLMKIICRKSDDTWRLIGLLFMLTEPRRSWPLSTRPTGRHYTYAEVNNRAGRLAAYLRDEWDVDKGGSSRNPRQKFNRIF